MATVRKEISYNNFTASAFEEPYSIKATNDIWKHVVVILNDTGTRIGVYGTFNVPKDYIGVPKIIIVWTSTATSGNAVFDFDYRCVAAGESLDQATAQASDSVTDAAPGTIDLRQDAVIAMTAGDFAVDDLVEFLLVRDGTDGSDTMAASAQIHKIIFEYTDA